MKSIYFLSVLFVVLMFGLSDFTGAYTVVVLEWLIGLDLAMIVAVLILLLGPIAGVALGYSLERNKED